MPRYDYNSCVPRKMNLGCGCAACNDLGGLAGLGDSSATEYAQPIGAVANMILPGSGTIIQMLGSIMDSVFGWGDPNSMDDLFKVIVQARAQLAVIHKQMGVPDDFHIPFGFDGSEHEMANLAMFVINELEHRVSNITLHDELDIPWDAGHYDAVHEISTHVWPAYQGSGEREAAYTAIKILKSELEQTQLQSAGMALTPMPPPPTGSIPPTYSATQQTSPPSSDGSGATSLPLETTSAPTLSVPMIAGGVGLVLLLLAMKG